MAWRNRVTPFGEIVAASGRGSLMGNRGILIDAQRRLVRDAQVRRWIACRLEFRDRHRPVMTPGTWTELFFLDEATALAAGHRPCAECRHVDFRAFQRAWRAAAPDAQVHADAMDSVLQRERRSGPGLKRTYVAPLETLPDGAFIVQNERGWLVHGQSLHAWSMAGYREHRPRPISGEVSVLTPPSIVAVLRAGYPVGVHPSAKG